MKVSLALALLLSGAATAQSPGTFTATGNMTVSHAFHTATVLRGKVLITGGTLLAIGSNGSTLASAELYDPSTGTFTTTGSMTTARRLHTATLLSDGQVLIAEGNAGLNDSLASAELYDPATATFTATGNLINGRGWDTALTEYWKLPSK
jgi:hypothetical protein